MPGQLVEFLLLAIGHDDLGSLLEKGVGHRPPQPTGAPGNESHRRWVAHETPYVPMPDRAAACPLESQLCLQVLQVAFHGGDREPPPAAQVGDRPIAIRERALHLDGVPLLRMPQIADRDIVVLTPEEGHGRELLPPPEDVARGDLSLPLGDDPVLDTDALTGVWIGPARDIARGVHAWG